MPIAFEDITSNHTTVGNQKSLNQVNGALLTPQPSIVAESQLSFPEKSEGQVKVNEVETSQSQAEEEAEPPALSAKSDEGSKHVNGAATPNGELATEVSATRDQAQQPIQAVFLSPESSGPNAVAEDKAGAIPPAPLTVEEKIARILNVLARYRINNAAKKTQWLGVDIVAAQLRRYIERDSTIRLVIPAFPFKSPNKISKVLGSFPDKAEEVALAHLNGLCITITDIHAPGAEVLVVSDGLMYSGLIPHDITNLQFANALNQICSVSLISKYGNTVKRSATWPKKMATIR